MFNFGGSKVSGNILLAVAAVTLMLQTVFSTIASASTFGVQSADVKSASIVAVDLVQSGSNAAYVASGNTVIVFSLTTSAGANCLTLANSATGSPSTTALTVTGIGSLVALGSLNVYTFFEKNLKCTTSASTPSGVPIAGFTGTLGIAEFTQVGINSLAGLRNAAGSLVFQVGSGAPNTVAVFPAYNSAGSTCLSDAAANLLLANNNTAFTIGNDGVSISYGGYTGFSFFEEVGCSN